MLIDRNYILDRYNKLLDEKLKQLAKNQVKDEKLYKIKMAFPRWIRSIIFHPFNPLYAMFLQYKAVKRHPKNGANFSPIQPAAVDFWRYCLTHQLNFDTNLYYPPEDEKLIHAFIDNRLKSCIPGYTQLSYTDEQLQMLQKRKKLSEKTKKVTGGYCLTLDNEKYYLPDNAFEEPVYIHQYGLKDLPAKIKKYIQGKDFLDVGAFIGDTAVFLLKNYCPHRVYTYEPVDANIKKIEKTIALNQADNIVIIPKGAGDKEGEINIYINSDKMSACSTNNALATNHSQDSIQKITITTIDKECVNCNVGLIKMDIEGAEYAAIKGGLETIKRDKPILLISLYHTGKDFFEIPPMLKEHVPDYCFRFVDIEIINPFSEKILVAYPSELQ